MYQNKLKLGLLFTIYFLLFTIIFPSPAFASVKKSGDIELITEEPLFPASTVWYPGLRLEKSFQVKNRGHGPKKVEIEAMSELVSKNLVDVLQFEVKEGPKTLYGGSPSKTLKNFFDTQTLELSEIWVNDGGKAYTLVVSMPDSAGNEYQGGRTSFDLRVGFPGDANSSVVISSNTSSPTTSPAVLSVSTSLVRTGGGPLVLGESSSPAPAPVPSTETPGNLSNSTENPFPWDRLIIVFSLLGSGTLITVFFLRNRL